MESLSLSNNSISDISPLAGLTNLKGLWLHSNAFSDISPLSGLTNLIVLDLQNNDISNISLLASFTNLTHLYLYNNTISNIVPLADLINLKVLNLRYNAISNIIPLVANPGLGSGDEVDVRNNPLSATSINRHIPFLQSRGVTVLFGASKPAMVEEERDIPPGVEGWKVGDYIYLRQMEE